MADVQPTPEQWRPVPDYHGYYEVSDHGRVRSIDRMLTDKNGREFPRKGTVLSPKVDSYGRRHVNLSKGSTGSMRMVHRLVLEAFVGPCPEGMECCHWDDDSSNNNLSNIRWGARHENVQDQLRNGGHTNKNKTHCPAGHPYDDENTYWTGRGRDCKQCALESNRRSYHRRKREVATSGEWTPLLGGECENGHEYTAENTYTYPDGAKRVCKTCRREKQRVYMRKYQADRRAEINEYKRQWRAKRKAEGKPTI